MTLSKLMPLLLLTAAFMLVVNCGGENRTTGTQAPVTKAVSRVEVEPSPTNEPATPESKKSATPELSQDKATPTLTQPSPIATPTPIVEATMAARPEGNTAKTQFTISGTILSDNGTPLENAIVNARTEASQPLVEGKSTANGMFRLQMGVEKLPVRVLVEVSHKEAGIPTVTNARWHKVETPGESQLGIIALPGAADAGLNLSDGVAQNDDGSIKITDVPEEVAHLFARSYDPDEVPEIFPGEFAEEGGSPLNSAVFMWVSAQDNGGSEVEQLSSPVTVRVRVPRSQWKDLEDIVRGTDRIELPIYAFDEAGAVWRQETALGWLEDETGMVLPEEAQPVVLDGSYARELHATFRTDHFSWLNLDYPFYGPWTQSLLTIDERNNPCMFDALRLAKAIALSTSGETAFSIVNQPGYNHSEEFAPGAGPEVRTEALLFGDDGVYGTNDPNEGLYGYYWGVNPNEIVIASEFLDYCSPGSTLDERKNVTLTLAATILHETAHWKEDHYGPGPGPQGLIPGSPGDPHYEEGHALEEILFTGTMILVETPSGIIIEMDGDPLDNSIRDWWLNPDNWPPANSASGGSPSLIQPSLQGIQQGSLRDFSSSVHSVSQTSPVSKWLSGTASAVAPALVADHQSGEPLQVNISNRESTYNLGQSIPISITYTNVSTHSIKVVNKIALEGWPAHFNIIDDQGQRIPFIGPEVRLHIDNSDFTTLPPGGSLALEIDLTRDVERKILHYQLLRPGTYEVTMVYEGFFRGIPETVSNTLTIEVVNGGQVTGTVSDAENGDPLPGATVTVYQGDIFLVSAVADPNGRYKVDLPAVDPDLASGSGSYGAYRLEARAPGYLRAVRTDVLVSAGIATEADFALWDLRAQGSMRIVLSYPTSTVGMLYPNLWLPEEQPYHIDYSRRGNLATCPRAELELGLSAIEGIHTLRITELLPVVGTYIYAVYNMLGSPLLGGAAIPWSAWDAQVQVYDTTGLIATYQVPPEISGQWWNVLEINAVDGSVRGINTVGADPSPYGDTGVGCSAQ